MKYDKKRGQEKFVHNPIPLTSPNSNHTPLIKPDWIRVKTPINSKVESLKALLRSHKLHTVCEEASCPNIHECFNKGTATFMIMGDRCTRRCAFCDVGHGKPLPLDTNEPHNLALAVAIMKLKYVVITSVDRDDLPDKGASHFIACILELRQRFSDLKIEILVPDFKGYSEQAVELFQTSLPDVFNHNLETVSRLYPQMRLGSNYLGSLTLIKQFKARFPHILTKSGLMLGLGEEIDEIKAALSDLKAHNCDMVTIGQYLQPSPHHAKIVKYYTNEEFILLREYALNLGFSNVASGPLVRSSYHADLQAQNL